MVSSSPAEFGQMMGISEISAVIANIMARHGASVLDDRRKLLGLLRDYVPGEARGVKLLMASFDYNTPRAFLDQGARPSQMMIDQQVGGLVASAGIQKDLANWATEAWSQGLYGKGPASQAATPSAEDLTWGTEVVSAPASIPLAPSATPAASPSMPPLAPSAERKPESSAAPKLAGKKPVDKFLVACLSVTALVGIIGFAYNQFKPAPVTEVSPVTLPQDAPATPPAVPPQNTPQTAPAQQAGDPVQSDGTPWLLTSTADDPTQWPLFNGASHPKNAARDWEFSFNSRISDGRLVVYAIAVSLNADLKSGTGYIRGLDLGVPDTNKMAVSPTVNVSRDFNATSKAYITTISSPTWQTNDTSIPPICVSFSSGANAKKFQPESGLFCASQWNNGACNVNIGCGHVN